MGLEGIDLLLETKKAFDITITDADIATPRQFIDLVAHKVAAVRTTDRRVQGLYFDLRRGFRAALVGQPVPRLDDPLAKLFKSGNWPDIWRTVRAASGRTDLSEKIRRPGSFWTTTRTLCDLVWSLAIELAPALPQSGPWTRAEVALHIRALIIEQGRSPAGFDEDHTWRAIGWP